MEPAKPFCNLLRQFLRSRIVHPPNAMRVESIGELSDHGYWRLAYDECGHVQEFAREGLDDCEQATAYVRRHFGQCLTCAVSKKTLLHDTPPVPPANCSDTALDTPGRRRDASESSGIRASILDAADRLFYLNGIGSVDLDAIVTESGAPKLALYRHFGSKDELVAAYLRRHAARYLKRSQAPFVDRGAASRERLLAIFDALAAWFGSQGFNGSALLRASGELADADHPGLLVIRQYLRDKRHAVASLTAQLQVADSDGLADQLLTLIHGATLLAGIDRAAEHAQHAKRAAAALIDAAVSPRSVDPRTSDG